MNVIGRFYAPVIFFEFRWRIYILHICKIKVDVDYHTPLIYCLSISVFIIINNLKCIGYCWFYCICDRSFQCDAAARMIYEGGQTKNNLLNVRKYGWLPLTRAMKLSSTVSYHGWFAVNWSCCQFIELNRFKIWNKLQLRSIC